MTETAQIKYRGQAYLLVGEDIAVAGWHEVFFSEEETFDLFAVQKPDAAHRVPFPFLIVEACGHKYVIEDDHYCSYHGICHVCRRKSCDKNCVPDFAKMN